MRITIGRRGMLGGAIAAGATALGGRSSAAATKWNLPAAYPDDNFHTQNLVLFAKDVEAATGGELTLTVHGNASLYKAPEIKRSVQQGLAQCGEVLLSLHENEDPVYGIDVVPFLATSFDDAARLWTASKPAVSEKLASQGLTLLYVVAWPPQGLYSATPVTSVEAMQGLKWRAYNVGTARIGELARAQPVTIQAAELPQALATGVVNSFMSSGSTGFDVKVWETLKYFYDVQAWVPKNAVFANTRALQRLDEPLQKAIFESAAKAETRGWQLAKEKTNFYLDEFRRHGMTVEPPSPELEQGFARIGEQLTADWVAKAGASGQAIIDSYRKG